MNSKFATLAFMTAALAVAPLAPAQAHDSNPALYMGLFAAGVGTAIALSADSSDTVIIQNPPPARVYYEPAQVRYVYRPAPPPPRYYDAGWGSGRRFYQREHSFSHNRHHPRYY